MPFLKPGKMHLEYISQIGTHVLGGKIEFATTKVSLEQNFHLKYFFKLFIPFSGVYLCISF